MAESKTQQRARLKAMRRKYGLGEFKNKRKSYSTKRGLKTQMAKRRRSFGRKAMNNKFVQVAGGIAGYTAYEVLISPKLPIDPKIRDVSELVVGYMLSKKSGIVGEIGKTAVYVNGFQLLAPLMQNALSSL